MRVLLAEDDAVLADGIMKALKQSGYIVDHAETGADAEHMLASYPYDMAILDLGLPDQDGLDVLKHVRAQRNTIPILILTIFFLKAQARWSEHGPNLEQLAEIMGWNEEGSNDA